MSVSFPVGRRMQARPWLGRLGAVAVVAFIASCGTSTATPTTGATGTLAPAGTPAANVTPAATSTLAPTGTPAATPTPGTTATPAVPSPPPSGSPAAGRPWLDATRSVDDRVAALLSQMTLEEKIGQMTQIEKGSIDASASATFYLGSILSGGGGFPSPNTPQAWYDMVDAYQQAALGTRLGIPMLYGVDAVHGHNNVEGATIFPQNVGMGATNDPALVQDACRATAFEMNATGVRWDFGPVIAVPQDVRWGRTFEGYGEDTDLVSRLGVACVKGLQDPGLGAEGTAAATAKHFIGDGGTAYGTSFASGPTGRYLLDQGVAQMDEATLLKMFLPPYRAAIESGARIVMTSYSSTTAGKVHGDRHLITDILKGQLGFTGFVVSDWGGIDQVKPGDYPASLAQGIGAGIDMVMVPTDYHRFATVMKSLVEAGTIGQDRVDDAVGRILRVKFEMGLFEQPMPAAGDASVVGSDAHRAIARRAVAGSAVLLKTSANALPIAASGGKVLLAGQGADDIGIQSGGWTITWQGSVGNITTGTTIAGALKARLGDRLTFDRNGTFPAGTKADVGIVVVSERPYAEGVGDTSTLTVPNVDVALVAKLRPHVKQLVVVVLSGRPVILDDMDPADAIVAAWLPGSEATGLADVLLGDQPFTGTTPYTWPNTAADAPRAGKTACDGAIYPFGYGLDATGKLLGPPAC